MEQNCKYNLEFSRFSREMHGEVDRGIDGNGYGTANTISIGVMSYSRLVAYIYIFFLLVASSQNFVHRYY